ncbi:MAG: hypothetical protein GY797_33620 [Deltaproteobacteria bacterium]|nr:hypothetical protein [Deltaproteobacteria bacterium]
MDDETFKGITQAEVEIMIKDQLDKHEHLIRELGCQSKTGCVAGKKHFQEHELKWSSDIYNLKTFHADQDTENKKTSSKLSEIANVFHDVVKDLSHLLKSFARMEDDIDSYKIEQKKDQDTKWKDQNKRINLYELRFWAMVAIIVAASLASVWRINTSVSNVNKVDLINQKSTEAFFALTISELTGKPVNEIIEKHKGVTK